MNAADIAILAVLALSLVLGLIRGFVSEVLSLACWVAAFWVAWALGHRVASLYAPWLHDPAARIVAGYVTCFVGVLILGALIGWALRGLMNRGGLRGGDRFLGALFGVARGLLLVTFAVLMLGFTRVPREAAWWQQSLLMPVFTDGAGWLAEALPPGVTHYLELGGRALPALSAIPTSTVERAVRRIAEPPAAATAGRAAGHGPARGDVGQ
ncbi:MAG: CvpA family protein [Rhodanobacteraceae bacterium]|nr:MAG: CvpA family protein [Rhodanobacteraceae bacterium]